MQPHVTQHELFIRAAQEGRRDHVYQACMFDPLTAATMTLDQIVEMCDELIAAHGGLAARPRRQEDARADEREEFRTRRRRRSCGRRGMPRRRAGHEDDLIEWKVLGPFTSGAESISLEFRSGRESMTGADAGRRLWRAGWKDAEASKRGFVDLNRAVGRDGIRGRLRLRRGETVSIRARRSSNAAATTASRYG